MSENEFAYQKSLSCTYKYVDFINTVNQFAVTDEKDSGEVELK